ncbi:MAG: 3'-5' exonuclease [Magnetococcales bacterium]|nr:3'-5' exonuclease [Magnetococcales bacterium]
METMAIIDFETTGLSPGDGARATEIAAIIIENGEIVRRYQSLMKTGAWISHFITELTGITNEMVRHAPPAAKVMQEVAAFVGELPLVAHNAAFDRKFWDAELALIHHTRQQEFACTMLTARRIYPAAPNHKLGTLAAFANLPDTGKAHRAMADALMTTHLLCHMEETLRQRYQIRHLTHPMLRTLQRAKVSNVQQSIVKFR